MDGIDGVKITQRLDPLPLGVHDVTLLSVREHKGEKGGLGVLVDVELDGRKYGYRIQLGGKFPEYGQRDVKALCAAVLGIADPAKAADEITKAVVASILSADQPMRGKTFRVSVSEDTKLDKNGKPYLRVRASVTPGTSDSAPTLAPAVPSIPAAPAFPPSGWQVHPQNPAFYFRTGTTEVLKEEDLRALVAVKAA